MKCRIVKKWRVKRHALVEVANEEDFGPWVRLQDLLNDLENEGFEVDSVQFIPTPDAKVSEAIVTYYKKELVDI